MVNGEEVEFVAILLKKSIVLRRRHSLARRKIRIT